MSRKKINQEINPAESKDQLITELIQQRKLQQGALLKIMDSIDKEEKEPDSSPIKEGASRRKRVFEKIFSTDKKNQK